MALSAPLLERKRIIKVILEAEKGTKLAGTQALLVEDLEINPDTDFYERKGTGKYLGHANKGVIGKLGGKCSFKTELRGNGSSGMEAGLAILLQACGLKKTLEVYNIASGHSDHKNLSIDVWEDGKKKGLAGAAGNVTFEGETGGRMMCNFEFTGIWQAPVDDALPAYAPSTTAPMMMKGGIFTLATESIKIGRFSLNIGGNVIYRGDIVPTSPASGIAYCMITDFDGPMLNIDPEADLVAGYDYHGAWLAGTEAVVSLVLNDGTDQVTFAIPKFQYREIKEGDRDGIQIEDIIGQCNHSTGDDAVTITAAAAA